MGTAALVMITGFIVAAITTQTIRQARTGKPEPVGSTIFFGVFCVVVILLAQSVWLPLYQLIDSLLSRLRDMQNI